MIEQSANPKVEAEIAKMERTGWRVVGRDSTGATLVDHRGVTMIVVDNGKGGVRIAAAAKQSSDAWYPQGVTRCDDCHSLMADTAQYCPKCGEPRTAGQEKPTDWTDVLTSGRRSEILNAHIAVYASQGYRVTSQTDTTAQLVKPKKFSAMAAFLWLLLFFIGLLVYIIYYVAQKDATVFLSVDERGNVTVTAGG